MVFCEIDQSSADGDLIDVRAFEFPTHQYGIKNVGHEFFEALKADCWGVGREICFLVFGYPTELQKCDYDVPHVHGCCVHVIGVYDGSSQSPHVHRLLMQRKKCFSSDGMSGGAVFFLGEDKQGFYVGLAGMIIRGSATSDFVHFIDADGLKLFANGSRT